VPNRLGTHLAAQACQLEIPDEDLICDAYPAGRDEADLQRIYRARRDCDWRPDPNPATRTQPPPAVMATVTDKDGHQPFDETLCLLLLGA